MKNVIRMLGMTLGVTLLQVGMESRIVPVAQSRFKIDEQKLGKLHDVTMSPTVSKDGRHLAYFTVLEKDCMLHELLNRWKWKTLIATKFGHIGRFLTVVVDGQPSHPGYDQLGENSLVFSDDGARIGYVVGYDRGQAVVVDGKPHRSYFGILQGSLVFSPNGKRAAYLVLDTLNRAALVVDGYAAPKVGIISDSVPLFSPDSKHIAYTAFEFDSASGSPMYFVVIDSSIEQKHEMVYRGSLVFSQVGNRLAYVVKQSGGCAVVVDGRPDPEYDLIQGKVVFSRADRVVGSQRPRQGGQEDLSEGRCIVFRNIQSGDP